MVKILGITASSSGGAVVTGGTLYTSGGFNYRVFTGNGTLGVSDSTLIADALVIAGGGGGGANWGGGGGATANNTGAAGGSGLIIVRYPA